MNIEGCLGVLFGEVAEVEGIGFVDSKAKSDGLAFCGLGICVDDVGEDEDVGGALGEVKGLSVFEFGRPQHFIL